MPLSEIPTEDLLAYQDGRLSDIPTDRLLRLRDAVAEAEGSATPSLQPQAGNGSGGVMGWVGREAPAMAGAVAGAAALAPYGAVAGPWGVLGAGAVGAGLGAAGGEGWRQAIGQATGAIPQNTVGGTMGQVAKTGGIYGAGQAVGGVAGKAGAAFWSAAKRPVANLAARVAEGTAGVPAKYGTAAMMDPSLLSNPTSLEQAGHAYAATTPGLTSLRDNSRKLLGTRFPGKGTLKGVVDDAMDRLEGVVNKGVGGKEGVAANPLTPQDALNGIQAANQLLEVPGIRQNKPLFSAVLSAKENLSAFLESQPGNSGFGGASRQYFNANVADQFGSWLPQNKGRTTNALRVGSTVGTAIGGVASMNPALVAGALGAGAAFSPRMWGYGIRAAAAAARGAGRAAPFLRYGATGAINSATRK